jgi:hypothetical protein
VSAYLSLQLDGDSLRPWVCVRDGESVEMNVPLGTDVFHIAVWKEENAGVHTMPSRTVEPTLDEVAEVIGRMWIRVSSQPGKPERKNPEGKGGRA